MNKTWIFSSSLFFFNLGMWLLEWKGVVGFSNLRHERIFWIPFLFVIIVSSFQAVCNLLEDTSKSTATDPENEKHQAGQLKNLVDIGGRVVVAISIMVSMPAFSGNYASYLGSKFYMAALLSFLWIFFGVFLSLESDGMHYIFSMNSIRKIKSLALVHALGWAGTCVVMVTIELVRARAIPLR